MSRIIPKLNLNKVPNTCENYSLVFAKNIRLDPYGYIRKDYDIEPIGYVKSETEEETTVYDNLLEKAQQGIIDYREAKEGGYIEDYIEHYSDLFETVIEAKGSMQVLSVISDDVTLYIFCRVAYEPGEEDASIQEDFILKYDEASGSILPCNCNWNYSGGRIIGNVIHNLRQETILNICEYDEEDKLLVPFKSINLTYSSIDDDETIYTQTPNIPITNLSFVGYFNYIIPNGTYQFYIRYKIRDEFYTDWFPATKPLYTGNTKREATTVGSVKYVDLLDDSPNSFEFNVNHLFLEYTTNYESFQIGYILSHDDAIVGRSWKHFSFDTTNIKFAYESQDIQEVEVSDFTRSIFQVYNIKNTVNFKNKIYISNYIESDKNPSNLQDYANKVVISLDTTKVGDSNSFADKYAISTRNIDGKTFIDGIVLTPNSSLLNYTDISGTSNSLLHSLYTSVNLDGYTGTLSSVENLLSYFINTTTNDHNTYNRNIKDTQDAFIPGIAINFSGVSLSYAQSAHNASKHLQTGETVYYNSTVPYDVNPNEFYVLVNNAPFGTFGEFGTHSKSDLIVALSNFIQTVPKYISTGGMLVGNDGLTNYSTIDIRIVRKCIYKKKVVADPEYDGDRQDITPIKKAVIRPGDTIHTGDLSIPDVDYTFDYIGEEYTQRLTVKFDIQAGLINLENNGNPIELSTLIPYQQYKFYIHFVKQSGEETNGYYCQRAGIITAPYEPTCDQAIYPIFSNIDIPDGYVGCFFSILHCGTITSTITDIVASIDGDPTRTTEYDGTCLDINLNYFPNRTNIVCKQEDSSDVEHTYAAAYHGSNDMDENHITAAGATTSWLPYRYFGADGLVNILSVEQIGEGIVNSLNVNRALYCVANYEVSEIVDPTLIKCTPYIAKSEIYKNNLHIPYDNNKNLNLLGFICEIFPLAKDRTRIFYTDGSTIYKKIIVGGTGEFTNKLNFKELSKYQDDVDEQRQSIYLGDLFTNINTGSHLVYSNYNLNMMTLTDDFKLKYVTLKSGTENGDTHNTLNTAVFKLYPSLELDILYKLPSMYHNFTHKIFIAKNDKDVIKYDNTIRSSIGQGDETSYTAFKFAPNEYYHIPVHRGKIVNVESIANEILVHTEDSLFLFVGNNSLSSNSGDVSQKETDVFETGAKEIFGSKYGFAGLQDKDSAVVTKDAYYFFDGSTKRIYRYGGNNDIVPISEYIESLMYYKPISKVYFAADEYNNRILVCIYYDNNYNDFITLSFSTLKGIASFISLHDFRFTRTYNTKNECYFVDNGQSSEKYPISSDILHVVKTTTGFYGDLGANSLIYPYNARTVRRQSVKHSVHALTTLTCYDSVFDVIVNENYTNIKSLNYIEWVAKNMNKSFKNIFLVDETEDDNTDDNIRKLLVSEPVSTQIPNAQCDSIRIYTDTSSTELLPCNPITNNVRLKGEGSFSIENSYKYPRWNLGKWTFNYFRNILNNDDKFKYNAIGNSDNKTLITGKYFVVRFLFKDDDFVLEELNVYYKQSNI